MKILLAGGGTGGHLFPAVALAQRLLETDPGSEVLFVGTERGIESRVLPRLGLPLETIDIRGFVGKGWKSKLALLPMLLKSLRQSAAILGRFKPDVVVGVGGYASGPLLLTAHFKGYPTLIHEQNAWPGLTNRILCRWADRVCLSFIEADRAFHRGRTLLTGNPLRPGMEDCPSVPEDEPALLVFGGSLGARAINEAMVAALPLLEKLKGTLRIRHQSGAEDLESVREGYRAAGWDPASVTPFIDDMATAYAEAHLVLCRAGATTIAELTACGRPSILVPFPHAAGDHQSANAQAVAKAGAGLFLPQSDLEAKSLAKLIESFFEDPNLIRTMAASARSIGKMGAADLILAECRNLAAGR